MEGLERRVREKIGLKGDAEVFMMSEGRRIGLRELGRTLADGLVAMNMVVDGGGKKKEDRESFGQPGQ